MNRRNVLFVLFAVLGVVADQAAKAWIVSNVELRFGRIQVIPGFLDIVHAQNPGAAFGFLGDFALRHWLFFAFTLVAGAVIVDMFRKLPTHDWYLSSALGLILSGAIGNAIDRVRQQYVTDFIRVYTDHPSIKELLASAGIANEWPSFNVADAALVVGVGMLIIHYLFFDETRKKSREAAIAGVDNPAGPEPTPAGPEAEAEQAPSAEAR